MFSKIPTVWMMLFALLLVLLAPSDGFVAQPSVAVRPATFFSTSAATTAKHPMALQMAGNEKEDFEDINPEPLLKPKTDTRPEPNLGVAAVLAVAGVGKLGYDVAMGNDAFGVIGIDVLFALVMVAGFVKTFREQQ
mmetsp:Transcript_1853/g.3570  ORF Transcript_1853/g.3570 Transcript_1853/m.3570 type:complete len:136 (+) Transcript_1853:107-514(+)